MQLPFLIIGFEIPHLTKYNEKIGYIGQFKLQQLDNIQCDEQQIIAAKSSKVANYICG